MLKLLNSPLVMILTIIGASLLLWSLWGTVQRSRQSAVQVEVLDQELSKMASEVSDLEQQVQIATTSAAQEKIIRDELLLKKTGETVVQLPPVEAKLPEPTPPPTVSPWQAWRQVLSL